MRATPILILVLVVLAMPAVAGAQSLPGEALEISDIETLVEDVVQTFITIAGLAVVGYLIYGGMKMAMSAGNDTKFKEGKDIVRNAIIGAAVIFGVGVIVNTIADFSQEPGSIIQ